MIENALCIIYTISLYLRLVKCFYCDGGLRNWQPEDDPWTEHARWFSECGFVRLVKGDEFISKCINALPPVPVQGVSILTIVFVVRYNQIK